MKTQIALFSVVSILLTNQAMAWAPRYYSSECKAKSVVARIAVMCAEADGCSTQLLSLKVKGKKQDLNKFTVSTDTVDAVTYHPAGLILAVNKESSSSLALIFKGDDLSSANGTVVIKAHKEFEGMHPSSEITSFTEEFTCEQGPLTENDLKQL
ncbi:hypothetical protein B9G69_009660 [Bdellovibrio sp. SKB1291214]|uniref:hypothetical protein n=1 Tax=Bdellovibrio sp. SKB1291214 TaxID=1732569 RepID=UPI000B5151E2|nr:hypothetical protein [Bdellovibrio sp. SKB1291214]UYL07311.1 hypothetical protein B9G69_009660 [Bdellovibrio sp. SKB1291214]